MSGLPRAVDVSVGFAHACALTVDAEIWCWGWNASGQADAASTVDATRPVRVAVTDVARVVAGYDTTCVIDHRHRLVCWGAMTDGDVVPLATDALAVALGVDHLCVVRAAEVRCFGRAPGGAGEALPAAGASSAFEGGDLASGQIDHLCATGADRRARCWGKNDHGQVGDGTFRFAAAPRPVRELGEVSSIAVGDRHACAVSGGRVFCWGWNDQGQIGDDSGIHSLVPVFVDSVD